jgi:hypothetical protein
MPRVPIMLPSSSDPNSEPDRSVAALLGAFGIIGIMVSISVAATLTGTPAGAESRTPAIYDPALNAKLATFEVGKPPALPPLTIDQPGGAITVVNCTGYLAVAQRSERGRALAGQEAARPYADCAVLRLLRSARRPAVHLGPSDGLGRAMLSRLDPTSLNGLAPTGAGKIHRLSDVPAGRVAVDGKRVALIDGDKEWSIEVVASADLLGSDLEDLVVRIKRDGAEHYAVLMTDRTGALQARRPEDLLPSEMANQTGPQSPM